MSHYYSLLHPLRRDRSCTHTRTHTHTNCSTLHPCRAIEHASNIFPGHVNLDLLFGRQGQTLQSWKRELSEVGGQIQSHHLSIPIASSGNVFTYKVCFCVPPVLHFGLQALQSCDGHMSLYQLTVEQGTPLARAVKQGTTVCFHGNPHLLVA